MRNSFNLLLVRLHFVLGRLVSKLYNLWNYLLVFLGLLFLGAFTHSAIVENPTESVQKTMDLIQWLCWFAFAIDYLVKLILAKDKWHYIKNHCLDLLGVILPVLRPLRLLRLLSIGSMIINKVTLGKRINISFKVAIGALFLAYLAAVQITIIERPISGSNIKSFGDGLWWAVSTVTIAGYGDRYPVSTEGRFIAFFLMLLGISLIGIVTASAAAWFVELSNEEKLSRKSTRE